MPITKNWVTSRPTTKTTTTNVNFISLKRQQHGAYYFYAKIWSLSMEDFSMHEKTLGPLFILERVLTFTKLEIYVSKLMGQTCKMLFTPTRTFDYQKNMVIDFYAN